MSAALVISDTHFGAWTGRDLLREEFFLERLAPALEAGEAAGLPRGQPRPPPGPSRRREPARGSAGFPASRSRSRTPPTTGGPEQPKTVEDYESVIALLTEWLYIAAQMPHGTHAQQNVFRAVQRVGRVGSALGLPVRGAKRLAAELRDRGVGDVAPSDTCQARSISTL